MINPYDVVVDVIHIADMDEAYVLMLLRMSNLAIMTMMMILMMIRPGEGGTFCWLAHIEGNLFNLVSDSRNSLRNSRVETLDFLLDNFLLRATVYVNNKNS